VAGKDMRKKIVSVLCYASSTILHETWVQFSCWFNLGSHIKSTAH